MRRSLIMLGVLVFGWPSLSGGGMCPAPKTEPVHALAYDVTDLGTFAPVAVNNRGQILGLTKPEGNHAGLWTRGCVTPLPLPRGTISCEPKALNDAGMAVGSAWTASDEQGNVRAVLWKNRRVILLSRRESEAMDINNADWVVGSIGNRAVVWKEGRARDLGGTAGDAALLNDQGDIIVAGWTWWREPDLGDHTYRAVRRPGRYGLHEILDRVPNAVLGILDPGRSAFSLFPTALNNAGEMAGVNRGHGDYNHCAFLWRPDPARPHAAPSGTIRKLTAPGDVGASATGLNVRGQVVGSYAAGGSLPGRACLWQNGEVIDLNTLLPPTSGWTLTEAVAINDRGQIVGTGKHNGVEHGFLLTPRVP